MRRFRDTKICCFFFHCQPCLAHHYIVTNLIALINYCTNIIRFIAYGGTIIMVLLSSVVRISSWILFHHTLWTWYAWLVQQSSINAVKFNELIRLYSLCTYYTSMDWIPTTFKSYLLDYSQGATWLFKKQLQWQILFLNKIVQMHVSLILWLGIYPSIHQSIHLL